MELGNAIREIRKKKGLSQKVLAEKCKISTNALCQAELGKTFPSKTTINTICKVLDIPVSYLLFFSLTEEDVPEHKKELFNVFAGLKDLLIDNA